MKTISILGATGSVGQNTIDLVSRSPEKYQTVALTCARNIVRLATDAKRLGAKLAVTSEEDLFAPLSEMLSGTGIEVAAGAAAIAEVGARPADIVMSAIVGAAGLPPGLEVLRRGGTLALANKETLVTAGELVMQIVADNGATLLPVDSEHSAIFQAMRGEDPASVERVIITASGGAFRDWPLEKLAQATPEQAATHPNWDMGQRITIDSASMFNKALELIETREFFGFEPEQIETIIHPQSLIHALVGHHDGGLIAHIGPHDMRHAIGYALNWPERGALPVERLDLAAIGRLDFSDPDPKRYPALGLAHEVMRLRGLAGAAFNAAKEAALDGFIAKQIGFQDMASVVEAVLDKMSSGQGLEIATLDIDSILQTDRLARIRANEMMARFGQ